MSAVETLVGTAFKTGLEILIKETDVLGAKKNAQSLYDRREKMKEDFRRTVAKWDRPRYRFFYPKVTTLLMPKGSGKTEIYNRLKNERDVSFVDLDALLPNVTQRNQSTELRIAQKHTEIKQFIKQKLSGGAAHVVLISSDRHQAKQCGSQRTYLATRSIENLTNYFNTSEKSDHEKLQNAVSVIMNQYNFKSRYSNRRDILYHDLDDLEESVREMWELYNH